MDRESRHVNVLCVIAPTKSTMRDCLSRTDGQTSAAVGASIRAVHVVRGTSTRLCSQLAEKLA